MAETDAARCTACGRVERASEGYPCQNCGKFICVLCNLRGVIYCKTCVEEGIPVEQPES